MPVLRRPQRPNTFDRILQVVGTGAGVAQAAFSTIESINTIQERNRQTKAREAGEFLEASRALTIQERNEERLSLEGGAQQLEGIQGGLMRMSEAGMNVFDPVVTLNAAAAQALEDRAKLLDPGDPAAAGPVVLRQIAAGPRRENTRQAMATLLGVDVSEITDQHSIDALIFPQALRADAVNNFLFDPEARKLALSMGGAQLLGAPAGSTLEQLMADQMEQEIVVGELRAGLLGENTEQVYEGAMAKRFPGWTTEVDVLQPNGTTIRVKRPSQGGALAILRWQLQAEAAYRNDTDAFALENLQAFNLAKRDIRTLYGWTDAQAGAALQGRFDDPVFGTPQERKSAEAAWNLNEQHKIIALESSIVQDHPFNAKMDNMIQLMAGIPGFDPNDPKDFRQLLKLMDGINANQVAKGLPEQLPSIFRDRGETDYENWLDWVTRWNKNQQITTTSQASPEAGGIPGVDGGPGSPDPDLPTEFSALQKTFAEATPEEQLVMSRRSLLADIILARQAGIYSEEDVRSYFEKLPPDPMTGKPFFNQAEQDSVAAGMAIAF